MKMEVEEVNTKLIMPTWLLKDMIRQHDKHNESLGSFAEKLGRKKYICITDALEMLDDLDSQIIIA